MITGIETMIRKCIHQELITEIDQMMINIEKGLEVVLGLEKNKDLEEILYKVIGEISKKI